MKLLLKTILFLFLTMQIITAQKFDDIALTPPMGWNSWNKFGCNVNEDMIKEMADAMVSSGMKDAGYEYIVIDDCWQVDRDENGNIIPDPDRFPSGMKALADYVHSKGLKFGLYSDAGTMTCQKRPGGRGYEFQDARTYAEWGVDYLKYDWCNSGTQNAEASYSTMRDAIFKAGRPIVFSICEWGDNEPWLWGKDVGHLWRTSEDIEDCWDCVNNWGALGVVNILDEQVKLRGYAGPGYWNDPDMLEIGNGGLTINESRAHFSLWAMLAAPLMAGNDLRNMSDEVKEILTNQEVIAVDQDSLGIQAMKFIDYGDLEVWFKPLMNNNYVYCFLNRSKDSIEIDFDLKHSISDKDFGKKKKYKIKGGYSVRNLWTHEVIGTSDENLKAIIPSHDVLMVRLSK